MSKKKRKFADDGWAIWIDGEDISTIHINDWLNPIAKCVCAIPGFGRRN